MSVVAQLQAAFAAGPKLTLEGLPAVGLPYLLAHSGIQGPLVIVVSDETRAEQLVVDLGAFGFRDVALFGAEAHVPYEEVSPDPRLMFDTANIRHRLLTGARPQVLVVMAAALLDRWLSDADFTRTTELYVTGQSVSRDKLTAHLVRCGYQPVSLVEDVGTFAVRGSIVDLFPPGFDEPLRIDLFGDDIASIKSFDPQSHRALATYESLAVFPIRTVLFDDITVPRAIAGLEKLAEAQNTPTRRLHSTVADVEQRNYFFGVESLWPLFYEQNSRVLDTLVGPDTRVVVDDATNVSAELARRWARAEHERERSLERHKLTVPVASLLVDPAEVEASLTSQICVTTVALADDRTHAVLRPKFGDWSDLAREMAFRRGDPQRGEILDPLVTELKKLSEKRHEAFLVCASAGHAERLRELLRARKLDLPVEPTLPDVTTFGQPRRSPRIAIVISSISAGFRDEAAQVALITDAEIFATPRRIESKRKKRPKAEGLGTLKDLLENDLVIHVDHGVGRYLGLKRIIMGGVDGDYVHLEYADGDKLYVPIYRLSQLQRYRGPSEGVKLDKLGGTRWEKAKQRVKDAVLGLAHDLLAMQARRNALEGFALRAPDDQFRAFEATFPYQETPDQQRAIDEVLKDLTLDKPMDRLLCGDVGFGKTEVAVRAAFLAVLSGKQVLVLVPTTVLAEQHGQTFRERLKQEPVTVDVLSRFRSAAEQREVLNRLKAGEVDILIGTHRMLSSDVAVKELGLLIIDEEHRFGVKQKERLKQWKNHVHVLSMSATPIPRTMHQSVTGLRDLSVITTPPPDRMSIRTEVTRFDEEVIQEAIQRELHRGGQVFVVHNRIKSIGAMAEIVERLVPEAKTVVAHGQMSGEQLEKIMVDFVRRETNVLVSTAIIESGIDIPSANTMIINRADMFGLSQLYQLRGRIGRGRERGYAYLLMPRSDKITRDAMERLGVLKRFSELGSGFQIASFDMDLRGAGDLLGADQSGHIAAVGFELYTELLREAVEQVKGQPMHFSIEPDIKLPVLAVLPESYVPEPMQRLAFYQRMAQSSTDDAIFDVLSEIEELYGNAPDEVKHLAEVMVIRRRLMRLGAVVLSGSFDEKEIKLGLGFVPQPALDGAKLATYAQQAPNRYRLLPSGKLMLTLPGTSGLLPSQFLRAAREAIGELPVLARGK